MRFRLLPIVALSALWACGGVTASVGDAGPDGSGGSSGGGSGSGSGGSSGGSSSGSGSSSGGSGSSSGGSSSGAAPVNHRPNDAPCGTTPPAGNCSFQGGPGMTCTMDSQCTNGASGRCVMSGGPVQACFCTYDACAHDSDCAAGSTCACHGSPYVGGDGNTCVQGNCRVDSDCGAGGYCSPAYNTTSCGGLLGTYCHTAADQCVNDSDCMGMGSYYVCTYSPGSNRWQCGAQMLCP